MKEEKKIYHEPELRNYGRFTDVTLDAIDDPTGLFTVDCETSDYW